MSQEKKNKKSMVGKILAIFLGFVLVLGTSYAVFRTTVRGEKVNKIETGDFNVIITEESANGVTLSNALPIRDSEGLQTVAYTFKVKNTGTISAKYTLTLETSNASTLPNNVIKYNLVENGTNVTIDPMTLSNKTEEEGNVLYKIDTDTITPNETKSYSLQLWIDYNATIEEASNKTFQAKVRVDAEQFTGVNPYKEGTAAYQVLNENKVVENYTSKAMSPFDSNKEKSGMYSYTDLNKGKTYYYRGNVENNYVSFGGKTWRIVRLLEDGSLRLILEEGIDSNTYYKYNEVYKSKENVAYKGSTIETTVNNWYKTNLASYDKYITTSTYCNDKRENTENALTKFIVSDYGYTNVFGIYARGTNNPITLTPDLSCETSDKVISKVALLTADEYALAGGGWESNISNYLVKSDYNWWTMSPALSNDNDENNAYAVKVTLEGMLGWGIVDVGTVVRPVISLNSNIAITSGSGSKSNPYIIK